MVKNYRRYRRGYYKNQADAVVPRAGVLAIPRAMQAPITCLRLSQSFEIATAVIQGQTLLAFGTVGFFKQPANQNLMNGNNFGPAQVQNAGFVQYQALFQEWSVSSVRLKFICPVAGAIIPVSILTAYTDNEIPMAIGNANAVVNAINSFDNATNTPIPVDNIVERSFQTWELKKRFGISFSSTVAADRYSYYGQLPVTSVPQVVFVISFSGPIASDTFTPIRLSVDYTLCFRNRVA